MNLQQKANEIRVDVIETAVKHRQGHIAPSLSCVDILVALYYEVMGPDDKFILSKAHGCYGLYAILADLGKMPMAKWKDFDLPGCAEYMPEYGIEAGCGSLGHGLPMAVGMAYAYKLMGKPGRIYCLVGDGEMQEGTCWEALQFASHHNLLDGNMTLIVDENELQAMDATGNIIAYDMYDAFPFDTFRCEGHDLNADGLDMFIRDWPIVLANTIKGYGFKLMENEAKWHFRLPDNEEMNQWRLLEKPSLMP